MALYPSYSSVPYSNPITEEIEFKTLFSNFDDLGVEKRKRKWLFPKRNITLVYNYITLTDARTLFQFYVDRYGAYEAFNFFKYEIETYENEYVGTGDASTVLFNLPCKSSTAITIYLDGSPLSALDYTFNSLAGTDGADSITFAVEPAAGVRITIDFSGLLKIRCRFFEDSLSFDTFYNKLRTVGIRLKGLLNE